MKIYAICPISQKKVNESVARLNAVFTVLLISGFFFTQNIFFVAFLGIDFFLRTSDMVEIQPSGHIFKKHS